MSESASQLNIEESVQLLAYLRGSGRIGEDEAPTVQVLRGGVSNRTVLVERPSGEAWVLKQALAKLRVPVDWFSSPERVHREALGMRWLEELAPPGAITDLIFEDHENHLIAMRAVPQPHENWKVMLLGGRLDAAHVEQFGELLAAMHGHAYRRRAEVAAVFADRAFFESLRLEPYYGFTAQQIPDARTFLHELIEQTRARRITLVHGDYSPKNILVHRDRLVLLDHEVIHWGDPAFDLGFSLTHLLSKAHHVVEKRSEFAAAAQHYWRTYRQNLGDVDWAADLEPWAVRHTLACLLARIDGRSPLEYLSETERARQRAAAVALMADAPVRVDELIRQFIERLGM
jgi:aminoglycoside phosphotransferase (APT) family kinase protein